MTAEQFFQTWPDRGLAAGPRNAFEFAEAYHRAESAAQLAEKEREIARLTKAVKYECEQKIRGIDKALKLDERAEAAEQRLQEAQAQLDALKELLTDMELEHSATLRQREAELEQALKLMRNYARGAISAELFRTKTETLLAEFTARQPLPSPPKVQP